MKSYKVTYTYELPKGLDSNTKKDIAEYLKDAILEDCSNSRSSVSGRTWKGLKQDYKKKKLAEVGSGSADLSLEGDMLDDLKYKIKGDSIEIGFFSGKSAAKADNHNKFSSESENTKVPKRQSIPKPNEKFRPEISNTIKEMEDDYLQQQGDNQLSKIERKVSEEVFNLLFSEFANE